MLAEIVRHDRAHGGVGVVDTLAILFKPEVVVPGKFDQKVIAGQPVVALRIQRLPGTVRGQYFDIIYFFSWLGNGIIFAISADKFLRLSTGINGECNARSLQKAALADQGGRVFQNLMVS